MNELSATFINSEWVTRRWMGRMEDILGRQDWQATDPSSHPESSVKFRVLSRKALWLKLKKDHVSEHKASECEGTVRFFSIKQSYPYINPVPESTINPVIMIRRWTAGLTIFVDNKTGYCGRQKYVAHIHLINNCEHILVFIENIIWLLLQHIWGDWVMWYLSILIFPSAFYIFTN